MLKYILSFFIIIFFTACGGGGSSSSSVEVASVPHAKSSIPMLGVLVNYKNAFISSSDTTWSKKLFGKSEHQLNHYFQEVSNLNFEFAKVTENSAIENDGIVSIYLNKDHPDKSIDTDYVAFANAVYPDLKQALEETDTAINYADYDTDGDGHITPKELVITFIIAGQEDAYAGGHVTNGIWAHEYCMEDPTNVALLDGVTLMDCTNDGNFALFGERHNNHDATIGLIAHELGHSAFRLPDLYNTVQSSGGIGYFGLMGGGAWGRQIDDAYPGNTPVHFTAWSKIYNGWITPTEDIGHQTMYATSSDSYNIVKIAIDPTSYYLLENRNNSGYDRGLYSLYGNFNGGIALWKIDTTKLTTTHFENNTVNADSNNKGVDLVEATSGSDTYLGIGDEDALYYDPNRVSYGSIVTDILSRGTVMSLDIN